MSSTALPQDRSQLSPTPEETALPQITKTSFEQQPSNGAAGPRRTSFNFLRRHGSGESRPNGGRRSTSGGKMSKKQKALEREELLRQQREAALLPRQPPRLPSHSPLPTINTFGGEDERPHSVAIVSNKVGGYSQGGRGRPNMDNRTSPSPHGIPIPPIPGSSPGNGEWDPYARTESMTHRGRYSYASSAVSAVNSPRRVRRRKDPTPFNILVVGTKSSGKTSFISFLRTALALPEKKRPHTPSPPRTALPPDSPFTSEYLETEIDNERIGVTLWDSQGLEGNIVDLQLREMASFLESKFEDTFTEEQKVIRSPGARDTHIHCVFLILDPARLDRNIAESRKAASTANKFAAHPKVVGGLDEDLDLQVLRTLQGKTTVIPVISKADTITTAHMAHLKKTVWDSLKQAKLDPLEALALGEEDEDEDNFDERDEDDYVHSSSDAEDMVDKLIDRSSSDARSTASSKSTPPQTSPTHSPPDSARRSDHRRRVSAMSATLASAEVETPELPYLPLSIISPDIYEPGVIGRKFPWGFADPYDPSHCDFVRLKDSVFSEWRGELREASRERWYEGWRTSRLKRRIGGGETPKRVGTAEPRGSSRLSPGAVANGRAVSAGGSPEAQRGLYRGVGSFQ